MNGILSYLSDELSGLELSPYMLAALEQAELAGQAGEIPIGSVIVMDGEIIARGRAQHKEYRSQVRHAELNAILGGGERLWLDYRRAILFTTVEPCPLCLGAAVMADIPHIIYALPDSIVHSADTLNANPYMRRHIRTYYGGLFASESGSHFLPL